MGGNNTAVRLMNDTRPVASERRAAPGLEHGHQKAQREFYAYAAAEIDRLLPKYRKGRK